MNPSIVRICPIEWGKIHLYERRNIEFWILLKQFILVFNYDVNMTLLQQHKQTNFNVPDFLCPAGHKFIKTILNMCRNIYMKSFDVKDWFNLILSTIFESLQRRSLVYIGCRRTWNIQTLLHHGLLHFQDILLFPINWLARFICQLTPISCCVELKIFAWTTFRFAVFGHLISCTFIFTLPQGDTFPSITFISFCISVQWGSTFTDHTL